MTIDPAYDGDGQADGFEAGPSAANLVEGLRDFGYSLETALADIVDNSISAGATHINIYARYEAEASVIGILDNGAGMTDHHLRSAMRLASANPIDLRAAGDLGRFGLGMKTASFSQCRRMTVASRKNGTVSTAMWDLDEVNRRDSWHVGQPDPRHLPWIDRLENDGTLVVWQDLDRVVGAENDERTFNRRMVEASEHLELVFHRFLVREGKQMPLTIAVNARSLAPFDPFARSHSATIQGSGEIIRTLYGTISVVPFTLPHHSNMEQNDWDRLGGRDGFIKNQGFYVYRARRLIVWGTWFGLAKQTERTKLARVLIDIPNSSDHSWKINILKASAEPPYAVRTRLKILIDAIVADSRRIYSYRGIKQAASAQLPAWSRILTKVGIRYQPNIDHPLVRAMLDDAAPDNRRQLVALMNLLAKTLPVDSLLHDLSDAPERVNCDMLSVDDLSELTRATVSALRARGVGWERLSTMMRSSPPFDGQWDDTTTIIESMKDGK